MPVIIGIFIALMVAACAGPAWVTPEPTTGEVTRAQADLLTTSYPDAREISGSEQSITVDRVVKHVRPATLTMCRRMYGSDCYDISWGGVFIEGVGLNAYADKDNRVVLGKKLISAAGSDDELAAVIAHENAHIMLGHIKRQRKNVAVGELIGILGAAAVAAAICQENCSPENMSSLVDVGTKAGGKIGSRVYSVEMEREADHIAAYILHEAGYDLDRAGLIWVRLSREATAQTPTGRAALVGFLKTHPLFTERYAAWKRSIREIHLGRTMPRRLSKDDG